MSKNHKRYTYKNQSYCMNIFMPQINQNIGTRIPFTDSRRRGGHSSVSANSLGGRDSAVLQSLGQDPDAAALSARLQGAVESSRHGCVHGREYCVYATPDATRVLSGNA